MNISNSRRPGLRHGPAAQALRRAVGHLRASPPSAVPTSPIEEDIRVDPAFRLAGTASVSPNPLVAAGVDLYSVRADQPIARPPGTPASDERSVLSSITGAVAIVETDAGVRVVNALANVGIHDLDSLCELNSSQLEAIPNLGSKSFAEIHQILDRFGMKLAASDVADARARREPRTKKPDPRLDDMIARRGAGETLDDIGRVYGVTRERVRQILRDAGPSIDLVRSVRADQDREAVSARRSDVLAAFRRGDAPGQIAAVFGFREHAVRELIRAEASDADRVTRRAAHDRHAEQRYTDDDLLAAIKEVAERYGRAPSSGEYAAASTGGMLPSLPTIHNRLGWANAVELAGYAPRGGRKRDYRVRWTEAACRAALIKLVVESEHIPTVSEYEKLAQLDPDLPSSATIRKRLGTWSRVTGDLVRLPTASAVLDRVREVSDADTLDESEIWLAYLDEAISGDDLVVLALEGKFRWNAAFGEIPPGLVPLQAELTE
jgi:hypothetical protein